jgi:hypothetical protein
MEFAADSVLTKKFYEFVFFFETKRGAWLPLLIVQGHKLA